MYVKPTSQMDYVEKHVHVTLLGVLFKSSFFLYLCMKGDTLIWWLGVLLILWIYLSVIYLSTHLSVCLFICLFIFFDIYGAHIPKK